MRKNLIIIGAGGHGKVIADLALKVGYTNIAFLDDGAVGTCLGFKIVGGISSAPDFDDGSTDFFVAIGDNQSRKHIFEAYDLPWTTLVHPSAQIGAEVILGGSCVIMAGSVINSGSRIGDAVIVNTCASVDHDCIVENYAHIAVGAHLAGTVSVGEGTLIGLGALVSNNLTIAAGTVVGAGAAVVRNLSVPGIYKGVPAKLASSLSKK